MPSQSHQAGFKLIAQSPRDELDKPAAAAPLSGGPALWIETFDLLLRAYGPQGWWPAQGRFEMMVGAVLVQHTAWTNVERAIENLRAARLLEAGALAACDEGALAELIRPAGTHRVKAGRLLSLARFVQQRFEGSLDRMVATDPEALRALLLGVRGVGPETADCILTYTAGAPRFVADAYARRVAVRHGWAPARATYEQVQTQAEAQTPAVGGLRGELHALLVRVGKSHCGPKPRCAGCPLQSLLPADGPCE